MRPQTRPGPDASLVAGSACRRTPAISGTSFPLRRARATSKSRRARRMRSSPAIGSTARISSAAAAALASVYDVETVVHAVDKVHVGDSGRSEHDRGAPRAANRREKRGRPARCRPPLRQFGRSVLPDQLPWSASLRFKRPRRRQSVGGDRLRETGSERLPCGPSDWRGVAAPGSGEQ